MKQPFKRKRTVASVSLAPSKQTARLLSRLAREARNGRFVAFAAVGITANGNPQTTWFIEADESMLPLMGAASRLQAEITHYEVQRINMQEISLPKRRRKAS